MIRRRNIRPTVVYWLVDIRPKIVATGWQNGQPFYCGKTVSDIDRRLSQHRRTARLGSQRPLCIRLRECGEFVRIQTVEIVSADSDWVACEKKWIAVLRSRFGGVNVTEGGQGVPGLIHSEATRARFRELGRNVSAETRAKMSAAHRGKKQTPEWIAKRAAGRRGKKHGPEARARISAAWLSRPAPSAETRAKLSAASRGRKQSPETIAKQITGRRNNGRTLSQEARARMSAAAKIRCARDPRRGSGGRFG